MLFVSRLTNTWVESRRSPRLIRSLILWNIKHEWCRTKVYFPFAPNNHGRNARVEWFQVQQSITKIICDFLRNKLTVFSEEDGLFGEVDATSDYKKTPLVPVYRSNCYQYLYRLCHIEAQCTGGIQRQDWLSRCCRTSTSSERIQARDCTFLALLLLRLMCCLIYIILRRNKAFRV